MPFLRRVTAGRGIPDERLQDVAHHYELFGGRSPINDQNRALIAALERRARRSARSRSPSSGATATRRRSSPTPSATPHARGLHRIVVVHDQRLLVATRPAGSTARTSPTPSPSRRRRGLVLEIDKIGPYALRPGFVGPNARLRRRGAPVRWPTCPTPSSPCSSSPTRSPTRWTRRPGPATARATSTSDQHHALARRSSTEVREPRARPRPHGRGRLLLPVRAADPALARTRRQRPPRGAGGRRRRTRRPRPDRLRLRPHGGRLRPRHRGRRDRRARSACSSSGCPPSGIDEALRRRPRRPARWSAPPRPGEGSVPDLATGTSVPRCARPGCCPNLRAGPPGALRERLMVTASALPDGRRPRRARGARHRARRARPAGWSSTSGPTPRRGVRRRSRPTTDIVTIMDHPRRGAHPRLSSWRSAPTTRSSARRATTPARHLRLTWVVDPIDGTVNYLYDIPAYAVSVAAATGTRRSRGSGRCSPERSPTPRWAGSTTRRRAPARTSTGGTSRPRPRPDASRGRLGRRPVRRAGRHRLRLPAGGPARSRARCCSRCSRRSGTSAASAVPPSTSARWPAAGSTRFYEAGLNPWDMAAGWLIVTEAGGVLTGPQGGPPASAMTVAGNPRVQAQLLAVLDGLG